MIRRGRAASHPSVHLSILSLTSLSWFTESEARSNARRDMASDTVALLLLLLKGKATAVVVGGRRDVEEGAAHGRRPWPPAPGAMKAEWTVGRREAGDVRSAAS